MSQPGMIGIVMALTVSASAALTAQEVQPVFDVHLHALAADGQGPPPVAICGPFQRFPTATPPKPYAATFMELLKDPPCPDPMWSPETDEDLMRETLRVMEEHNVYGVLSGTTERVAAWSEAAPGRFTRGLGFTVQSGISPDSLRALHGSGTVQVLAEITNQYRGIAPDDPAMDPYWALAEELDMPVGIHIGPGPPGAIYLGFNAYRARLHSPLALEEVLVRHPSLRVYVMHAGFPMLDDLLALLYAHPQVHVGIGVIVYSQPRPAFYRYLQGIVEAGFEDRVMFGSDHMVWPEAIARSIRVIQEAPFLDESQKRKILYDNAARFLGLTPEEIARHHR